MNPLLQLKKSSLTLNEALILGFIRQNPKCRQRDIVFALGINITIVSLMCKKFREAGMIHESRSDVEDKRNWSNVYRITDKGLKAVQPFLVPDMAADGEMFNHKFGFNIKGKTLPSEQADSLVKHLHEEADEFAEAYANGDRKKMLDALIDICYLAIRHAKLLGMDFYEGWRRVHSKNMEKIKVRSAAESKRGTAYDVKKPEGWVEADLSDLV